MLKTFENVGDQINTPTMSDDEMHDNASDDMQMDDSAPNVEENEGVETELTTDGGLKKTILKKGEGYQRAALHSAPEYAG